MQDSPILLIVFIILATGISLLLAFKFKIPAFSGKIPEDVNTELENEGLLFLEKGIPMTIRLRNFRAPGRYSSNSIKSGRGTLAISQKRMVGYVGYSHCIIDIPFEHPKIDALNISTKKRKKLCIAFEASEFNDEQSGEIELRFGLTNIPEAVDVLNQSGKKCEITF